MLLQIFKTNIFVECTVTATIRSTLFKHLYSMPTTRPAGGRSRLWEQEWMYKRERVTVCELHACERVCQRERRRRGYDSVRREKERGRKRGYLLNHLKEEVIDRRTNCRGTWNVLLFCLTSDQLLTSVLLWLGSPRGLQGAPDRPKVRGWGGKQRKEGLEGERSISIVNI